MTVIRLEPCHIEFADKIALMRRRNAVERNWRGANGAPEDEVTAMAMDLLGARAEAAAKLFLNPVKWHAFVTVATYPDLDDFIDAKGIAQSHHRLIIQPGKPEDWAYLLVDATNHPDYEMCGWCWGHEGKAQKYWTDYGERSGYFISKNDPVMKKPHDLWIELRMRQTERTA